MRRTVVTAALMLMTLGLLAGPATAHGTGEWGDLGEHPHSLLIGVETIPNPGFDPADPTSGPPVIPIGYERCVDLAGGTPLPKANHHNSVHRGKAGAALVGAGHMVAPYTCAQIAGMGD